MADEQSQVQAEGAAHVLDEMELKNLMDAWKAASGD